MTFGVLLNTFLFSSKSYKLQQLQVQIKVLIPVMSMEQVFDLILT
jgi:hypothetical protein